MRKKHPVIRLESKTFTHLPDDRIEAIKTVAKAIALKKEINKNDAEVLLENAAPSLTKYETGMLAAFCFMASRGNI